MISSIIHNRPFAIKTNFREITQQWEENFLSPPERTLLERPPNEKFLGVQHRASLETLVGAVIIIRGRLKRGKLSLQLDCVQSAQNCRARLQKFRYYVSTFLLLGARGCHQFVKTSDSRTALFNFSFSNRTTIQNSSPFREVIRIETCVASLCSGVSRCRLVLSQQWVGSRHI